DLVINGPRDANASRLSQALQARRNIDPISIDLLPLRNDISQVDAQAKLHLTPDRELHIPRVDLLLDGDCTLHRLQHTGKLGQQVISWGVYDATSVLLHDSVNDASIELQGVDGRLLILAHQAAIPRDISTEDRRKFACHTCR